MSPTSREETYIDKEVEVMQSSPTDATYCYDVEATYQNDDFIHDEEENEWVRVTNRYLLCVSNVHLVVGEFWQEFFDFHCF